MKVGSLVKWRATLDIGIVLATRSSRVYDKPDHYSLEHSVYVQWNDHDACWMNNSALEVLSESR